VSLQARLLTSPGFQRWALRFPLTRFIARRRAAELFDLCAGFVYSQVLLACVRLRLFELLAQGPQSVARIAARTGLSKEATLTLLHAAVALRLVRWRGFERECDLGRHGAALLGNPSLFAMIEHHALLYADLQDPVHLLQHPEQSTRLGAFWPYAQGNQPADNSATQVGAYTTLMSVSQAFIAAEVLDAYELGRHRSLLDVGGGDGTFCTAAAQRAADLEVRCFDLPAVAERAQARFSRSNLTRRAEAIGGDFVRDPLPTGADIVSFIRVLHDHSDATVMHLLRAARAALPGSGGTLLIAEPVCGTRGGERVADAYFGFYLLAMGSGKPRSFETLSRMIVAAGFSHPRLRATRLPMNVRVLVAAT
jgi:demethylspheroidene O-methyltransferase